MEVIQDIARGLLGAGLLTPAVLVEFYAVRFYYGFAIPQSLARLDGWLATVLIMTALIVGSGTGVAFLVGSVSNLLATCGLDIVPRLPFVALCVFGTIAVPGGIVPLTLLVRRQYLRDMEAGFLRCANCGYSLRGTVPQRKMLRCPECGRIERTRDVQKRARFENRFARRVRAGEDLRIS